MSKPRDTHCIVLWKGGEHLVIKNILILTPELYNFTYKSTRTFSSVKVPKMYSIFYTISRSDNKNIESRKI